MLTQTINYTRKHNFQVTTPTPITNIQRWPCTRTNARRQAVLATIAAYIQGHKAYQWVRVNPPVPA